MKFKYSRDDIHRSETFDLSLYGSRDVVRQYLKEKHESDENRTISDIFAFIEVNHISSFYSCTNQLRKLHPDWYPVFQTRFMLFKCFLDSKEKSSKFGSVDDLEKELDKTLQAYNELQSKVYSFLQAEYPDIELSKLNEFFANL